MTNLIKTESEKLGFDFCGFTGAGGLDEEASRLQEWLKQNFQAGMDYLKKNEDLRGNPRALFPPTKSVIILLYNYFPGKAAISHHPYKISKYALGRDYHKVIRKKAKKLVAALEEKIGPFQSRICVDSAPIMEKALAQRAGLGRIGKNCCFIVPDRGSYFFLCEILVDLELDYGLPINDVCGDCRLCLDACPTKALAEPYVIDAGKCISYLTIEHKGELPENMRGKYRGWIFGCDICQDVCPHNKNALKHNEVDFNYPDRLDDMSREDWHKLTESEFDELFRGSAVMRAGYLGLKRNIEFIRRK